MNGRESGGPAPQPERLVQGRLNQGRGKDTFGSGALPRCQEDTLFLWSQPDVLGHAGRKEGSSPQAERSGGSRPGGS